MGFFSDLLLKLSEPSDNMEAFKTPDYIFSADFKAFRSSLPEKVRRAIASGSAIDTLSVHDYDSLIDKTVEREIKLAQKEKIRHKAEIHRRAHMALEERHRIESYLDSLQNQKAYLNETLVKMEKEEEK